MTPQSKPLAVSQKVPRGRRPAKPQASPSASVVGDVLRERLIEHLLPYQWKWVCDESPMKLGRKSRRSGWTYCEALRAVLLRLRGQRDHWFSSADETATLEFIEYCRFWADFIGRAARIADDVEIFDHRNKITIHRLTFANGKRITALTSNPTQFRSKGGDATWDEAAHHDDQRGMWNAVQPTTLWGGQLSIFSNPNSEGDLFEELSAEAEGVAAGRLDPERDGVPAWSYYHVTIADAVAQGLAEKIAGTDPRKPDAELHKRFLKDLRAKARDEETWLREYMCTASGESTTLLPYQLIRECSVPAAEILGRWGGSPLYAGFDVGRERDLSVLAVTEAVANVLFLRALERWEKTPYRDQKAEVTELWRSHPIRRFCGDATGIGDNLVEDLQFLFGRRRVEKVKFTEDTKEDLAIGLLNRFEDRNIRIPQEDRALREALHKVRKTVTSAGNVRYDAMSDSAGHADEFWAVALADHAAGRRGPRIGALAAKPAGF